MPLTIHYYHIQILEKKKLKMALIFPSKWVTLFLYFLFFQVLAGDECANHDEETASSPDTNQSLKTSTCLPATPPGSTDLHQPLQNNKPPQKYLYQPTNISNSLLKPAPAAPLAFSHHRYTSHTSSIFPTAPSAFSHNHYTSLTSSIF